MNILRSVEWRVTWPQGLPLNLLIFSVKLSMSSSFLYSPERQRRIVQLFMATVEQGPLTPVKQRILLRKIAEVTQVSSVVILVSLTWSDHLVESGPRWYSSQGLRGLSLGL